MKKASFLILFVLLGCPGEKHLGEPRKPDEQTGKKLLAAYGCATCHVIDGVADYPGQIGPSLENWALRKYVAGKLDNSPENLALWIRNPQKFDPKTAMPDLRVDPKEAKLMSEYLFSQ